LLSDEVKKNFLVVAQNKWYQFLKNAKQSEREHTIAKGRVKKLRFKDRVKTLRFKGRVV